MDVILIFWPHRGIGGERINRIERFSAEGIRCNRAALEIPKKSCANLRLGFGQNDDPKTRHRTLNRALASAQGTGFTVPARKAA